MIDSAPERSAYGLEPYLEALPTDWFATDELLHELLAPVGGRRSGGLQGSKSADFRILLSLAKPVLTALATRQLHEAIAVLGGNGIEERFSPLPRLYRDSVIMETWEGPHSVLFTQAARDIRRFEVEPARFVERLGGRPDPGLAARLAGVVEVEDPGEAAVLMAHVAPALIELPGRERGA